MPGTIESRIELGPRAKLLKDVAEIIYSGQDNMQDKSLSKLWTNIDFYYVNRFSYFFQRKLSVEKFVVS